MQKGGKEVQIACTIACVLNERPLIDYELCICIYYNNLNSDNTYRCITNPGAGPGGGGGPGGQDPPRGDPQTS